MLFVADASEIIFNYFLTLIFLAKIDFTGLVFGIYRPAFCPTAIILKQ